MSDYDDSNENMNAILVTGSDAGIADALTPTNAIGADELDRFSKSDFQDTVPTTM